MRSALLAIVMLATLAPAAHAQWGGGWGDGGYWRQRDWHCRDAQYRQDRDEWRRWRCWEWRRDRDDRDRDHRDDRDRY